MYLTTRIIIDSYWIRTGFVLLYLIVFKLVTAKNSLSQHIFSIFPTTRFSGKNKYIFYMNKYIIVP